MRNLACERDERLLFVRLNARFYAGQAVQILGPNGSGKTTLLRILAGVNRDYQGDIYWQGKPVVDMAWEFANDLLYLGHLPGVKKSLTPLENLRWYAALQGSVADAQLLDALVQVNLAGYEDTPCYQLSAGQLRRVGLARLFFSKARIWILDEPFTALDKSGIAQLENRLIAHAEAGGLVLVTSHQDIRFPQLQTLNMQDFVEFSTFGETAHG
ncbi:MAG: cytochrome c biogenesis heme-transporting ATPase CcmA [Gammaproteobacteria bacterium]|nr:MAG: cytochrome c biogenesis heme-transporting ATPase CcmA [Gammaproteobacteria bacterium]